MITREVFDQLAAIVADLSRAMPEAQRFERLLDAFQRSFPCDAIALLKRENGTLVPCAVRGLSPETLGRRFVIAEYEAERAVKSSGSTSPRTLTASSPAIVNVSMARPTSTR